MRILLYLAALAIFLIIVNVGARWLGNDIDAQPPEQTSAQSAPSTAPSPTPAVAVLASPASPDNAPSAAQRISLQPGPEPQIGSAQPAKPPTIKPAAVAAPPAAKNAPAITPSVAEAAPEPIPSEQPSPAKPLTPAEQPTNTEDGPGAIERFADSAQEVAESAVDSVTDTIKTVSAVITGAAAADTDTETTPAPLVEPTIAVTEANVASSADAPSTSTAPAADNSPPVTAPRRMAPEPVDALLRRHPNKNLVVMFWEPGADSVKASFEWLTRVQTRYGSQNLHTIAVNVAPRGSNARGATVVAHATNVEQRSDPERILARAFWIQTVPSLYIVKPDGTLHHRIDGFDPNRTGSYEDSVRSALRR